MLFRVQQSLQVQYARSDSASISTIEMWKTNQLCPIRCSPSEQNHRLRANHSKYSRELTSTNSQNDVCDLRHIFDKQTAVKLSRLFSPIAYSALRGRSSKPSRRTSPPCSEKPGLRERSRDRREQNLPPARKHNSQRYVYSENIITKKNIFSSAIFSRCNANDVGKSWTGQLRRESTIYI